VRRGAVWRVESAEQPGQEALPEAVVRVGVLRGKSPREGEDLAGDSQFGDEADAVAVAARRGWSVGHLGAVRVVITQVSPDYGVVVSSRAIIRRLRSSLLPGQYRLPSLPAALGCPHSRP